MTKKKLQWLSPFLGLALMNCGTTAPGSQDPTSNAAFPLSHANSAKNTGEEVSADVANFSADASFEMADQTTALCGGGRFTCHAHAMLNNAGEHFSASTPTGLSPANVQSAYGLPTSSANAPTVAIVDAFGYKTAEADLAVFRSHYGLPACTTANGCLKIVNQNGQTSPLPADPSASDDWTGETALDLDSVSSACPSCKILLVQATTDQDDGLFIAQNTAVSLGATVISNSWSGGEDSTDPSLDTQYFTHPGVSILVASGDSGFESGQSAPGYPTSSPEVIGIGGTTLSSSSNSRGWTETVWSGTGAGCSGVEPKPSYQSGVTTGCANRAYNDVSAVADPNTGLGIYDTDNGNPGWEQVGGTSLATPITAGILAATGHAGVGPSFFYGNSDLFDVTSGNDGTCSPAELCKAGAGWDGPTGNGTPNGAALLSTGGSSSGSSAGSSSGSSAGSTGGSTGGSSAGTTGGSSAGSTGGSSAGSSAGSSTGGGTTGGGTGGSATEQEPNNSTSTANVLAASVATTGKISSTKDVDYFRIQVARGSSIDLTLTGLTADCDLRLYNSSNKLVAISDNSGTANEEIAGTVANSVYYAKVNGYNGAECNYTIELTVQ